MSCSHIECRGLSNVAYEWPCIRNAKRVDVVTSPSPTPTNELTREALEHLLRGESFDNFEVCCVLDHHDTLYTRANTEMETAQLNKCQLDAANIEIEGLRIALALCHDRADKAETRTSEVAEQRDKAEAALQKSHERMK